MENWQVGDRIVVRTVGEMLESGRFYEGNTYGYGDILLSPTHNELDYAFNKHMQYLCGRTGVISRIENECGSRGRTNVEIEFDDCSITLDRFDDGFLHWYISPGMIKRQEYTTSDNNVASFLDELFSEL